MKRVIIKNIDVKINRRIYDFNDVIYFAVLFL